MHIEKSYFTLPEILDRWQITEADLIYLAENDRLRLCVRVFGVPIEFCDFEETPEGEAVPVPWEQTRYSGLLDLYASDVFQLFRCGEITLNAFRTPRADCATTMDDSEPVFVLIGDLLLTREERDRFEIEYGFTARSPPTDTPTFIHSADYQEVCCNAVKFKLGPIQAEVIRALHASARAGEPWQNGKAILCGAGSKCLRMADVFKSQKNWRRLIRSDRRGGYCLNLD